MRPRIRVKAVLGAKKKKGKKWRRDSKAILRKSIIGTKT